MVKINLEIWSIVWIAKSLDSTKTVVKNFLAMNYCPGNKRLYRQSHTITKQKQKTVTVTLPSNVISFWKSQQFNSITTVCLFLVCLNVVMQSHDCCHCVGKTTPQCCDENAVMSFWTWLELNKFLHWCMTPFPASKCPIRFYMICKRRDTLPETPYPNHEAR